MTTVQERVKAISDNKDLNLDTPYTTAKVELSGICTLQCDFCYNQVMRKHDIRQKIMPLSDLHLVIEQLRQISSMKEVGLFYMGESAINPNISLGYKILKDNGYFTYLTTNATNIRYIESAIPYIDSLKVSWNYTDVDDFVKKTNSPKTVYYNIISNIAKLYNICHTYGKELTISTVLDTKKQDYEEAIKNLKYDYHYYIPLQTQGGTNIKGIDGVVGESESPVPPMPCWSLFKGVYIDVDLNVRTCCYGHKPEQIIGNLRKDDLVNILNCHKTKYMKQLHLQSRIPEECIECLRNQ